MYDKTDERRLRARKELFNIATKAAGHPWQECDITAAFAEWMAQTEYRESYFEHPEDLELKLEQDFHRFVANKIKTVLQAEDVDDQTVVALFGVASVFGFTRVSELMKAMETSIRGRIVVFFPGEYESNNYRLLDARDGWNYLAVPITVREGALD